MLIFILIAAHENNINFRDFCLQNKKDKISIIYHISSDDSDGGNSFHGFGMRSQPITKKEIKRLGRRVVEPQHLSTQWALIQIKCFQTKMYLLPENPSADPDDSEW